MRQIICDRCKKTVTKGLYTLTIDKVCYGTAENYHSFDICEECANQVVAKLSEKKETEE